MDHRTITRKNNAGHLILSALLLCQPLILSAINPQREYSVPIEERGKNFEELQVETTDGFKINVWHLPSENGTPLIISESDAGNMGDWVHLGRFLFRRKLRLLHRTEPVVPHGICLGPVSGLELCILSNWKGSLPYGNINGLADSG